MNDLRKRYGDWAMVLGAAEGIGAAFSRLLSESGMNLILVDHNRDALSEIAAGLETDNNTCIRRVHLDLASAGAPAKCIEEAQAVGCRLMVYVAAFSKVGSFLDLSPAEIDRFVNVNSRSVIQLVHGFAGIFRNEITANRKHSQGGSSISASDATNLHNTAEGNNRPWSDISPQPVHESKSGKGLTSAPGNSLPMDGKTGARTGILLISSLAGLIGPPLVAAYAATKSFNILLAESLHHELKPNGIDVTVCIAGMTVTPMFLSTKPKTGRFQAQIQDAREVARYGLKNLGRKAVCISGARNRASFFLLTRLLTRSLAGRLVAQNIRKLYK